MSAITTHVLDTSTGRPGGGMRVALAVHAGTHWRSLAESVTDEDGRCRDLTREPVEPGVYRLTFATGEWFTAQERDSFHPEVEITFEVKDDRHHHVPLLVAPFGYSTYRGS
jgi:5-hydroxyisourate hydrolase